MVLANITNFSFRPFNC